MRAEETDDRGRGGPERARVAGKAKVLSRPDSSVMQRGLKTTALLYLNTDDQGTRAWADKLVVREPRLPGQPQQLKHCPP